MLTGKLKASDNGGFVATISTMQFDLKGLSVVPSSNKSAENHPDFHVNFVNGKGRAIRIGAMWAARSKSGNDYYSISLSGPNSGRTIRMNAVRNEESEAGVWEIIPLAGGETVPAAVSGIVKLLDDGNLEGSVGSFRFDFDFVAIENAFKETDDHPDYHIETRSPAGALIRMGSIWKAKSPTSGKHYLSMRFYDPLTGNQHRANAVRNADTPDGQWEIIPLAERNTSELAAA